MLRERFELPRLPHNQAEHAPDDVEPSRAPAPDGSDEPTCGAAKRGAGSSAREID